MTRTIGIICASYIACNVPPILLKIISPTSKLFGLGRFTRFMHESKYSLNFAIYAASNKQYREAYLLFLSDARRTLCKQVRSDSVASAANTTQNPQQVIKHAVSACLSLVLTFNF